MVEHARRERLGRHVDLARVQAEVVLVGVLVPPHATLQDALVDRHREVLGPVDERPVVVRREPRAPRVREARRRHLRHGAAAGARVRRELGVVDVARHDQRAAVGQQAQEPRAVVGELEEALGRRGALLRSQNLDRRDDDRRPGPGGRGAQVAFEPAELRLAEQALDRGAPPVIAAVQQHHVDVVHAPRGPDAAAPPPARVVRRHVEEVQQGILVRVLGGSVERAAVAVVDPEVVVVVDAVEDFDRRCVAPVGLVLFLSSIKCVQDRRVRGHRLGRGEELLRVAIPRWPLLQHRRVAVAVDDVAAPEERVGVALFQDAPQWLRLVRVAARADVDSRSCRRRRHGLVRTCSAFCAASASAAAIRCYKNGQQDHGALFR